MALYRTQNITFFKFSFANVRGLWAVMNVTFHLPVYGRLCFKNSHKNIKPPTIGIWPITMVKTFGKNLTLRLTFHFLCVYCNSLMDFKKAYDHICWVIVTIKENCVSRSNHVSIPTTIIVQLLLQHDSKWRASINVHWLTSHDHLSFER